MDTQIIIERVDETTVRISETRIRVISFIDAQNELKIQLQSYSDSLANYQKQFAATQSAIDQLNQMGV